MPAIFARRKQRIQFLVVAAGANGGFPVTVDVRRNSGLTTVTFASGASAAGDVTVQVFPPDFNDIILGAAALPPIRTNAAIIGGQAVQVSQYDVSQLSFVAGDVHNNSAGPLTILSDWFLS